MTRATRRRADADAWPRSAEPVSPWFDRRGRPRTARRSGRVLIAVVIVLVALCGLTTFALAADISNHTVLSNGRPEHHGTLDDPVWIPPADASWDIPPPSPSADDSRPDQHPAVVDPPTVPGAPAPRAPTTPTTPVTGTPAAASSSTSTVTSGTTTTTSPSSTTTTSRSSTTTTSPSTTSSTTRSTAVAVAPDTATAVVAMNDARAEAGCTALRVDSRLTDAARTHAEELAAGRGDTGAAARMLAAGYPAPGGENVARGQASLGEATSELLASTTHRANVVDCSFTGVGLAHAAGARGDYWVQDFGR